MINLDILGQKPTHLFLDVKPECWVLSIHSRNLTGLNLSSPTNFYLVVSYLYPEMSVKLCSLYYQPTNEFLRSHNSRVDIKCLYFVSFYYVHWFNVVLLFILLLVVSYPKIHCQDPLSRSFFSSRSFMVSVLTFKSLIHLIFVGGACRIGA